MRRSTAPRGAALVLGAVALVALVGCSSDDADTSGGPSGSSADSLVVRLRAEFDRDPLEVRLAADALPHVLGIDAARLTATPDGTTLEFSVADVTEEETEQILQRVTNPKQILARPVLSCSPQPADGTATTGPVADADQTQEMPSSDGTQWCMVGPTSAFGEVFNGDAEAASDGQQAWVVNVSLSSASGTLNAVVRECFERTALCPSGQVALGLGSELILVAPANVPELGAALQISALPTEAEAESIAADLRAYSVFWGFTVESTATSEG